VRGRRLIVLTALGLATLAVAAATGWTPVLAEVRFRTKVHQVESHAEAIRYAAVESGFDPNLLAAIMYVESGGDVEAVSHVGALGLYQLMLPTAVERARVLGLPEPTREDLLSDALLNARLGADYLRWLSVYCSGDLERMLVTYNAGPGRVKEWVDGAGGWDAWRRERKAAGNSQVLGYAQRVRTYRDRFAARGVILPPGHALPAREEVRSGFVRPPAPVSSPAGGDDRKSEED
jgi:soluble lytic murein transglycosylase